MASAWLIRRFIDPEARFGFTERPEAPAGVVPFDMFGVPFGHQGHRCTLETLVRSFGIEDEAVEAMCCIVHQVDLQDDRFSTPEAPAMDRLVRGMRLLYADDGDLLESGILLFESLYRSFEQRRAPSPASRLARRGARSRGKPVARRSVLRQKR
jgi:hypothetical protein